MMKKNLFMSCLTMFAFIIYGIDPCYANVRSEEVINLQNIGNHDDHFNFPIPADQPDVYYNNVSQTIIIDGGGEVGILSIADVTTLSDIILGA
jgi:hypothetical protein